MHRAKGSKNGKIEDNIKDSRSTKICRKTASLVWAGAVENSEQSAVGRKRAGAVGSNMVEVVKTVGTGGW